MGDPLVSDYLKYLPPFLSSPETDPRGFLGRFLCVFEALLTGRAGDDRARDVLSVEAEIDRLSLLFDPWRTPAAFLSFLAARLGLTLEDDWDDYQRRRLVESIVGIYQQRWLKKGLYTFLDLYGASGPRPRVVIDDGEALFAGRGTAEAGVEFLDQHTIAFSRPGPAPDRKGAALIHPIALAVGGTSTQREYLVADSGPMDLTGGVLRPALWRLSPDGQLLGWPTGSSTGPFTPIPLNDGEPDPKLTDPCAVVADKDGSYLVLDRADPTQFGKAVLYRYQIGQTRKTVLTATKLGASWPVDMAMDSAARLLILDQGPTGAGQPSLLRVAFAADGTAAVTPFKLFPPAIPTPVLLNATSLLVEQAGTVLIADARQQTTTNGQTVPYPPELQKKLVGDVVRVTVEPVLKVESLLGAVAPANNPLIYPNAILPGHDGAVLVCDLGLKSGRGVDATGVSEAFIRVMAEPASLYRVDLTPTIRFTPLRLALPMVNPVRLAWDGDRLLVLDYGMFQNVSSVQQGEWRAEAHQFGVVVIFSATRPTKPEDRRQIFETLTRILEQERPAHVVWNFQFAPDLVTPTGPGVQPIARSAPQAAEPSPIASPLVRDVGFQPETTTDE